MKISWEICAYMMWLPLIGRHLCEPAQHPAHCQRMAPDLVCQTLQIRTLTINLRIRIVQDRLP